MTITLRAASEVDLETLTSAFNAAYEGYIMPVNLSPAQLTGHIENNDVDLNASLLAYEDDQIVGMGLVGIRGTRGWIGGVGVVTSHRRHGIGRQLMQAMIDNAHQQGVTRVQLEVIEGNSRAIALYEALGFETVARLLILERQPQDASPDSDSSLSIAQASAVDVLAHHFSAFHRLPQPWQRDLPSLDAQLSKLSGWIAREGEEVLAYGVAQQSEAVIRWEDVAFAPGHEAALRALLLHVHRAHPAAKARLVNLRADDPAWAVMRDLGYSEIMSQREMWLEK